MRTAHPRLALALLGLAACASGSGRSAAGAPGSNAPAMVVFTNESMFQADVFALPRSGTRVRIGTVQSGRTDTLRVSSAALGAGGSVAIAATLLTSNARPTTGQVTLLPGEWIAVTLPSAANTLNVLPVRP